METWTAGQLAWSNGAYAGKTVTFDATGEQITGTLKRAQRADRDGDVLILVEGRAWRTVSHQATPVEVA
jgi:hypothetical protein